MSSENVLHVPAEIAFTSKIKPPTLLSELPARYASSCSTSGYMQAEVCPFRRHPRWPCTCPAPGSFESITSGEGRETSPDRRRAAQVKDRRKRRGPSHLP